MSLKTNIYFDEYVAVSPPITLSRTTRTVNLSGKVCYTVHNACIREYMSLLCHTWCFDNSFKCGHCLPKRRVHHDMTASKDNKVIALVHDAVYFKRTCVHAGRTTSKHSLCILN